MLSPGLPRWRGKPSISPTFSLHPPTVIPEHTRPRASWGPWGSHTGFPLGPEQFLPLHPLFNYPENSAALSAPNEQLRFLPSSPLQEGKLLFPVIPHPSRATCTYASDKHTHAAHTGRQPPA